MGDKLVLLICLNLQLHVTNTSLVLFNQVDTRIVDKDSWQGC